MPYQLLVGILIGALVVALLWVSLNYRRANLAYNRTQENHAAQSQLQTINTMIDMLEFAVVIYDKDGLLQFYNQTATDFIGTIPPAMTSFFDRFGSGNDLQANFLLHNRGSHCVVNQGERALAIEIRKMATEGGKKSPTVTMATILDVTYQEREYQQKRDFVANVSHELRTPLTTIKTYTESLLDWGLAEKKMSAIKKDVKRVYEDSLRMEKLVEDLLLLSSLDSRRLFTRVERLDFLFLSRQVVDRMKSLADRHQVTLELNAMQALPLIYADRSALERVIENVISNACKYSDKGSVVYIYLGNMNKDVYLKVKDAGRGISEEDQAKIFDRFYRVDRTGSRQQGGTGLGLPIAKELVTLHHGRILVSSLLGKGSEFTVMLPSAERIINETFRLLRQGQELPSIAHQAAGEDLELTLEELARTRDFSKCDAVFTNMALEKIQAKGENE